LRGKDKINFERWEMAKIFIGLGNLPIIARAPYGVSCHFLARLEDKGKGGSLSHTRCYNLTAGAAHCVTLWVKLFPHPLWFWPAYARA